jgi:GNAT superfamily N-acetyltransferase
MEPLAPIVIRDARGADAQRLGQLLIDAFLERYREKMPEVRLNDARLQELRDVGTLAAEGASVLVAEHGAEIVGTVTLLPHGAAHSESWIDGAANLRYLAVDPRFHGRGVSGPLLDAAEDLARASGVPCVCLHVRRGAVGVANLYRRRGYERVESADLDLLPLVFLEAYRLDLPRGA